MTDEAGNTYNMRIELVMNSVTADKADSVELELTFYDYNNHALHTAHYRPVWLDNLPGDEVEEDD